MKNKTTVIVTATANQNELKALEAYASDAHQLLVKTEAKGITLWNLKEKIHGEGSGFVFTMEFPNDQSVKDFFNGDEYMSLIKHREKAFTSFDVFIVESGEAEIKG